MRNRLMVAVGIVAGCVLAGLLVTQRGTGRQAAGTQRNSAEARTATQRRPAEAPAASAPVPVSDFAPATDPIPAPVEKALSSSVVVPPKQPVHADIQIAPRATPAAAAPEVRRVPQPAKPAQQEPLIPVAVARQALFFVGVDPYAEAIWIQAINDPDLSRKAREDLIEDLNEEGFPNPKRVTPDDLPLIVNRLLLIEELAPDAMDKVNADAFREAYKDLVKMFNRLTRP